MTSNNIINELRACVTQIDCEILSGLNRRGSYAKEIGKLKKKEGLKIIDEDRENFILNDIVTVAKLTKCPYSEESIRRIYKVIMEETRKIEEKND